MIENENTKLGADIFDALKSISEANQMIQLALEAIASGAPRSDAIIYLNIAIENIHASFKSLKLVDGKSKIEGQR